MHMIYLFMYDCRLKCGAVVHLELRKRFGQDLRNYLLMHAAFKKMIVAQLKKILG